MKRILFLFFLISFSALTSANKLPIAVLGLGAVPVGAFQDEEVKKIVALLEDERPLLLVPVGVPAGLKD